MAMTPRERFVAILGRLQTYHYDTLKAQSFDGPRTSHSKPSSQILQSNPYPGTQSAWDAWRNAKGAAERQLVIEGLHAEYRALYRRPHRLEEYRDQWGKTRHRRIPIERHQ